MQTPQKIYVLQSLLDDATGDSGYVVDGTFTTLQAAQDRVRARYRGHNKLGVSEWVEHGAHGPSWTATVSFRINSGPVINIHFVITEHDLEE